MKKSPLSPQGEKKSAADVEPITKVPHKQQLTDNQALDLYKNNAPDFHKKG